MIDTIKPMGLDLSKDLHGHVRVELHDRWTGRVVDSQEKDNLVTDAMQKVAMTQAWTNNNTGLQNPMFQDVLPLHSKGLGGLLLFNGTLTESASNVALPSTARLVGFAGQTADTANALKGSYNAQESIYTSTGFSTVWDFLTSQANGTIASLARTSYGFISSAHFLATAAFGYGNDASTTPGSVAYLGYDETNKYLYVALTNAATIGGVVYPTSNIYRVKAEINEIGLWSYLHPISQWTLIKSLTSSDGTTSAASYVYDPYENNFVYANGTTLHLIAMDGTHTTKNLAGTSGGWLCVTENYYWRAGTGSPDAAVYCIEKANTANVQAFNDTGSRSIRALKNDMVVTWGGGSQFYPQSALVQYRYPDGTIIDVPDTLGSYVSQINRIGSFWSAGGTLFIPTAYLGTIANLDSPVTKSSSQTMKIIYTLTEA